MSYIHLQSEKEWKDKYKEIWFTKDNFSKLLEFFEIPKKQTIRVENWDRKIVKMPLWSILDTITGNEMVWVMVHTKTHIVSYLFGVWHPSLNKSKAQEIENIETHERIILHH